MKLIWWLGKCPSMNWHWNVAKVVSLWAFLSQKLQNKKIKNLYSLPKEKVDKKNSW